MIQWYFQLRATATHVNFDKTVFVSASGSDNAHLGDVKRIYVEIQDADEPEQDEKENTADRNIQGTTTECNDQPFSYEVDEDYLGIAVGVQSSSADFNPIQTYDEALSFSEGKVITTHYDQDLSIKDESDPYGLANRHPDLVPVGPRPQKPSLAIDPLRTVSSEAEGICDEFAGPSDEIQRQTLR